MKLRALLTILTALVLPVTAEAADEPDFAGKTVTIIVASKPGGGTDVTARLIAQTLTGELKGKPTIIVRNIPGAAGMTGHNYFMQQTARDGFTLVMGVSNESNPVNYRKAQSKYDPTAYAIVGGVRRGGSVLIIRTATMARLNDRTKEPVVMGSVGAMPNFAQQMTAWGIDALGWNAKWVVGYHGTDDLMLALDRGEVDIVATSNLFQIQKLREGETFTILTQTGNLQDGVYVKRPEFASAPLLSDMLKDKLTAPSAGSAFEFWKALSSIDKWIALAPEAPPGFVETYRAAYLRMAARPEFKEGGRKISADFDAMSWQDIDGLLKRLGSTPPEAMDYMNVILRKQGIGPQ